jgi:hypothetical protein
MLSRPFGCIQTAVLKLMPRRTASRGACGRLLLASRAPNALPSLTELGRKYMLPDRAIWCTARALIALCCDDERIIGRANAYLRDGNIEKYIEWMRVLSALSDLRETEATA